MTSHANFSYIQPSVKEMLFELQGSQKIILFFFLSTLKKSKRFGVLIFGFLLPEPSSC